MSARCSETGSKHVAAYMLLLAVITYIVFSTGALKPSTWGRWVGKTARELAVDPVSDDRPPAPPFNDQSLVGATKITDR